MTKRKILPKAGDIVYFVSAVEYFPMRLEKVFTEKGVKKGKCIWTEKLLQNGIENKITKEGVFEYRLLTLSPPPPLAGIYSF